MHSGSAFQPGLSCTPVLSATVSCLPPCAVCHYVSRLSLCAVYHCVLSTTVSRPSRCHTCESTVSCLPLESVERLYLLTRFTAGVVDGGEFKGADPRPSAVLHCVRTVRGALSCMEYCFRFSLPVCGQATTVSLGLHEQGSSFAAGVVMASAAVGSLVGASPSSPSRGIGNAGCAQEAGWRWSMGGQSYPGLA